MPASSDELYLAYALRLAASAGPEVSPNPAVGAVVVRDGRIIGEGVTSYDGGPHAEVEAMRSVAAPELLRGATVYVSLEPCSIYGRTPPCCDALAAAAVGRVVVGCIDFTAGVCGRGLERLRLAGTDVRLGVCQAAAFEQARARRVVVTRNRPYVILKQAVTDEGLVGVRGGRLTVTAPPADVISHTWRAGVDAILVGATTVAADDPALTVRHAPARRPPLRVVLDPRGRTDPRARVFAGEAPTAWAIDRGVATPSETVPGATVLALDPADRLGSLLRGLHERRIGRLLVEGGPQTLRSFVAADSWDEYREWRGAPAAIGAAHEPVYAAEVAGDVVATYRVGRDRLRVVRPHAR